MCRHARPPRHAWQRPRPPRHALQRPRHALQHPRPPRHAFSQGPRSPTSKKYPPTCCLISCEAKGVVYHQASICLGRCEACQGRPRTLSSMPTHLRFLH